MRLLRAALAIAAATLGCDKRGPETTVDTAVLHAATSSTEVRSPDGSYTLMLPARWTGLIRTDTLATAERGTARAGAMNIVYLPRDTSIIPQTLVVVAVYDSVAWQQLKAAGGPPPGDSLMSKDGRVYVLALPQSNPFTPGSVDAVKFDSLALKPADSAALVRIP